MGHISRFNCLLTTTDEISVS